VDNTLNNLPKRVYEWLIDRQLSHEVLEQYGIGWNGFQIEIPVRDENGNKIFNKYRRDPVYSIGPKYYFDKGSSAALYNIQSLKNYSWVIICEGELDALVLISHGFPAVTSTAGAATFKKEWVEVLKGKEIFFCMDNDPAGKEASRKLHQLFPTANMIPLPAAVKDVTDFFVMYTDRAARKFQTLIDVAFVPDIPVEKPKKIGKKPTVRNSSSERIDRARATPIRNFLKVDSQGFALCPFHSEKTGSLKVFPDNKFKCFGCGVRGDVMDIVGKIRNVTLPEALKIILCE